MSNDSFSLRNNILEYLRVAVTAFLIFALSVIPCLVMTKGIWIYYGDFNVQQIPFYIHAHEAIRNGNLLYDWGLDLGGSLLGCFSFYLLGSPFFWLTLPFEASLIPYLLPWISALKYTIMAVTAYAYAKRHLKTANGAFIAALLYTFSGFQGAVLVYNHFHDVMAFFPLYLILFEKAMEQGKRIPFILMTSFMAILNYYFFVGEVVFLIIYFVAKYVLPVCFVTAKIPAKDRNHNPSDEKNSLTTDSAEMKSHRFCEILRLFFRALYCGVTGVCLAGIYLIPAVYYTLHSSRVSDTLLGYDLLAYKEPMAILAIIKNTVMLPDISGLNSMYNQSFGRVSGVAAYIPLFSVSLVIAFFLINKGKKMWEKNVIAICIVFAAVPFLNAVFSAMNSEYYARWFYMPILVMAVMTASLIETGEERAEHFDYFLRGGEITLGITLFISLTALIPAKNSDGEIVMLGALKNVEQLIAQIIFSAVMLILFFLYIMFILDKKDKYTVWIVIVACFLTTATMLTEGTLLVEKERKDSFISQALSLEDPLVGLESDSINDSEYADGDIDTSHLGKKGFYRIETEEDVYNYPLLWDAHSITSFISTIPASTIDFYTSFGVRRKVTSNLSEAKQGMRTFLSGRYFLKENETAIEHIGSIEDMEKLKGYEYVDERNGFSIYENENFIPMGFSFDTYITESEFEEQDYNSTAKDKLLVRTVVLSDEVASKYSDVLTHAEPDTFTSTGNASFISACEARRESACTDSKVSTNGFSATSHLNNEGVLVFTVPYETGFTAYVDGNMTEISIVDYGFMMIKVPAGEHNIEFVYKLSDLKYGIYLTMAGIILLTLGNVVIYFIGQVGKNNKKETETA